MLTYQEFIKQEKPKPRTPRDFVRDMAMRGRTDDQIRGVASVTRWNNHMKEVMEWCQRRGDRWRSKYTPPKRKIKIMRKLSHSH